MANSKIEWTQATWNPITGCSKVSNGCDYCYAQSMSKRLRYMGVEKYKNEFTPTTHEDILGLPLHWKKSKLIFVDSMGDLFHEKIPLKFIKKVFSVMKQASWHQFQVLTKRSERLVKVSTEIEWPLNVWMGVSVENQECTYRIGHLQAIKANIKFLSLEPLLGPIQDINLEGINWVIVGGESGQYARPIQEYWAIDIRNMCVNANIPFFFKQWGGKNKSKAGRLLQGKIWDQMPEVHTN